MLKAYTYRLYPNNEQKEHLQWTLDRCRELYNAALQERRDAYRMRKVSISYHQQAAQLPEIKEIRPEYSNIHSQVLQDVLRRVDKAYKAFFRRVKEGKTPGFPRFKGYGAYDSFTYPQSGFSLPEENRVYLAKMGTIKVKMPKGKKANPPQGKMKTCSVKREGEHWYIAFVAEVEPGVIYHPSEEAVGIDLGLLHFATLSTGETIDNPRHYRKAEQHLKTLQQAISRKKRGSHRRKKAAKAVGKVHRTIANQRKDFLHKESRRLVTHYQLIVFEDLCIANMSKRPKPKQDGETGHYLPNGASAKAGLNKSIHDAGWNQFVAYCTYKAEWAGGRVVHVDPRGTSQRCSGCGAIVSKTLDERWHSCSCGVELDRDHNSARDILRLGLFAIHSEQTRSRLGRSLQRTRL